MEAQRTDSVSTELGEGPAGGRARPSLGDASAGGATHSIDPPNLGGVALGPSPTGGGKRSAAEAFGGGGAGKLDEKLVAKAVRAVMRKAGEGAGGLSKKELRERLEKRLGCDLSEWKHTIKAAAVEYVVKGA